MITVLITPCGGDNYIVCKATVCMQNGIQFTTSNDLRSVNIILLLKHSVVYSEVKALVPGASN